MKIMQDSVVTNSNKVKKQRHISRAERLLNDLFPDPIFAFSLVLELLTYTNALERLFYKRASSLGSGINQ
jgi:hypothetical protein